ncbi:hypothetical protein Pyn_15803 [Prunus yedoensis var. nudiflora]|uniref:Uncharacterized protein n=1 Tax=Prunus yedoensis var. nudiflora TaxID=2094558 RepID=A0A314XQR7_PRUYE|nr:hypothetical protein Pyn_15803 [Prunus yedoensis var. nudiflora]
MRMKRVVMVDGIRHIWAAPPVNKKPVFPQLPKASLEGDDVSGVELLLLDESAPALCHHIALAAVPVGVSKPPWLPIPVLEIEQKPLLVGGRIQRKVLLCVLLWDDEAIELPHIAWRHNFVEHVLPFYGDWVFFSSTAVVFFIIISISRR